MRQGPCSGAVATQPASKKPRHTRTCGLAGLALSPRVGAQCKGGCVAGCWQSDLVSLDADVGECTRQQAQRLIHLCGEGGRERGGWGV